MVKRGDMLGTGDILDVLAIELIGVVPDDDSVIVASNQGLPAALDQHSKAGRAFRAIARRLAGEQVPFEVLEAKDGFFGRLSRLVNPGGEA
jgi:septum site-determining protein MinD